MQDKIVDRRELAAHFKVSIPTVDRWIRDGIPVMKPSPGVTRFDLDEVIAWAKNHHSTKAAV